MKLKKAQIHGFRSIADETIELSDYTLLVGANNAGKSNFLNALRVFYDEIKWTASDEPKFFLADNESWIELTYTLSNDEWQSLADKYKEGAASQELKVRRYFKSDEKDRVKSNQSNIYGYVKGVIEKELFYGAKNVGSAKLGKVIFIPALASIDDQTKLTGPSPLRDVLNFLIKKIVSGSPTYAALAETFAKLNEEAKGEKGFLSEVANPLNEALASWNIQIDLSVNSVKPEDISRNLVSLTFLDLSLDSAGLDLGRYGHGFQRSVIYELIRLAPTFRDVKVPDKKEFNPDLTIVLFEEPEAFLHPAQQETMAQNLRKLSLDPTQQIVVCTHSTTFVGKAAEDIGQIVRFCRVDGRTKLFQVERPKLQQLFSDGTALLIALQSFVADPSVAEIQKKHARKFILNPPSPTIAEDEERFRYQMWLDGERSSMFFADRVLLVEGASERALFNYLLVNDWFDLSAHRICVVDVLGKYNFHRYITLLNAFQIPFGVLLDDDNNKDHHGAVNDLVDSLAGDSGCSILSQPERIPDCLETFLGLPALGDRNDKKPIEILKAITAPNGIASGNLTALREVFKRALALP